MQEKAKTAVPATAAAAYTLAKTLGISQEDAAKFIDGYFATYHGVAEFMLRTLEECRRKGYVSTILGRRIEIEALHADGSRIPVELSILQVQDTSPALFVGHLRSIAERRRSERRLKLSAVAASHRVWRRAHSTSSARSSPRRCWMTSRASWSTRRA